MTIRIYQPIDLEVGQSVELEEKASHHLARVLRVQIEDELVIFNGKNKGEFTATITKITKKSVTVDVNNFVARDNAPGVHIHLAQGLAKGEKMDWIIQKAVELGVSEITPLTTEYSNVKLTKEREEKRLAHWQQVMISACEQSGRADLPILHAPRTFHEFTQSEQADLRLILSPRANMNLTKEKTSTNAKIILCIGPEGGFSDAEIQSAAAFTSIQLGKRILRTETAAIAAITAIQVIYGDFS